MIEPLALRAVLLLAGAGGSLLPPLPELVRTAPAAELLPVYAVLAESWDIPALERAVRGLPKEARRALLASDLRARAERSQARLLRFLRERERAGEAAVTEPLWIANAVIFRGTPSTVAAVAAFDEVLYVGYDAPRTEAEVEDIGPVPAAFLGGVIPPNVQNIGAPAVWSWGVTGQGIVVANADSGVANTHPDLANQIWTNPDEIAGNGIDDDGNGKIDDMWGWDFQSNDNSPTASTSTHGTNTAGIVVGDGTQGQQTGLAPGAKMMSLRISGEANMWAAQQYAVGEGADVLTSSHSYKWYFNPKPNYHMHRQICDLEHVADLIHTNSTSNDGQNLTSAPIPFNISAPGNVPGPWRHTQQVQTGGVSSVLGCAAVLLADTVYAVSPHGPSAWEDMDPTYIATWPYAQNSAYWDYPRGGFGSAGTQPGLLKPDLCGFTLVPTTTGTSGYLASFSGTSAATPHIGGCCALLRSANPTVPSRKISEALQRTALDLGVPGKDPDFGAGRARVDLAVKRILVSVTADDPTPSIGTVATLALHGPPGKPAIFFLGFNLGSVPIPPIGTLEVNIPWVVLFTGPLPPSGDVSLPIPVPNDSTIVNQTVHLQGVADDTAGATGSYLISLVESVTIAP